MSEFTWADVARSESEPTDAEIDAMYGIDGPEASAAYREYVEREEKRERGVLGFRDDALPCYECTRKLGDDRYGDPFDESTCVQVQVVAPGPVVEQRRDPTQTYRLACGHVTI